MTIAVIERMGVTDEDAETSYGTIKESGSLANACGNCIGLLVNTYFSVVTFPSKVRGGRGWNFVASASSFWERLCFTQVGVSDYPRPGAPCPLRADQNAT